MYFSQMLWATLFILSQINAETDCEAIQAAWDEMGGEAGIVPANCCDESYESAVCNEEGRITSLSWSGREFSAQQVSSCLLNLEELEELYV